MSDLTMTGLFDAYIESIQESEPERAPQRRSHLRNVAKNLDCDVTVDGFTKAIDVQITKYKICVPKRSSHAPAISTLRMALRWAYNEKLLSITPDLPASLRMPSVIVFANWREYQAAPTVYKVLLAEMKLGQVSVEDLDESFFEKFLAELPCSLVAWRAGWREFRKCWENAVEEGVLPEIDLPEAPSQRRAFYRVAENKLPEHLTKELVTIRNRLRGGILAERRGVKPYDDSTVELLIGSLLRLTGFLVQHCAMDLQKTDSFGNILTVEHGLALINHVNDQWLTENEIPEKLWRGFPLGKYEIGLLCQFAMLARIGLCDDVLDASYGEEIKYRGQQARARREKTKDPGRLNDYFRVAAELAKRGIDDGGVGLGAVRRATIIRDALAFALFATFGYRISKLTNLELDKHIRRGENGQIVINIRKEVTKPGLRDLVYEVPRELIPLFEYYLNDARQVLLKGCIDHKRLFVSSHDGSPIGKQAIYAMFITRTAGILGEVHNPHQVRKAWATDWAQWTKGDYITASSILDNTPLTLQRNYAKIIPEEQIGDFDDTTEDDWTLDDGGVA